MRERRDRTHSAGAPFPNPPAVPSSFPLSLSSPHNSPADAGQLNSAALIAIVGGLLGLWYWRRNSSGGGGRGKGGAAGAARRGAATPAAPAHFPKGTAGAAAARRAAAAGRRGGSSAAPVPPPPAAPHTKKGRRATKAAAKEAKEARRLEAERAAIRANDPDNNQHVLNYSYFEGGSARPATVAARRPTGPPGS